MKSVFVWDRPTRVFHWLLAAGIIINLITGGYPGVMEGIHIISGHMILALLAFRVVWGFLGGEHARFKNFAYGPKTVWAHLQKVRRHEPDIYVGHNPAGGISVFLILLAVLATVITGWMTWKFHSHTAREIHEVLANIVLLLAIVHVAGVWVMSRLNHENLVKAMVTGHKVLPDEIEAHDAAPARKGAFAAAISFAVLVLAVLVGVPGRRI